MYNLLLDDVRTIEDVYNMTKNDVYTTGDWVHVVNYEQFVDVITRKGMPAVVSFDHDLAFEHYTTDAPSNNKTGHDCAKWFVGYCATHDPPTPPRCYVHSMNPVGARNIIETLKSIHTF